MSRRHKFISDLFTGVDGETYDMGRVLLMITVLSAIFLTFYSVMWKGSPFDIAAYGAGVGGLLFGGGGMLWLKRDTEPKPTVIQTQTIDRSPPVQTTTVTTQQQPPSVPTEGTLP